MSSIAQTYMLAGKAREKLTKEAQKADLDLRVLVCHANLLDTLMESLQNHKYENSRLSKNYTSSSFIDSSTVTFVETDSDSSGSDSDSEDDEEYDVYEYNSSIEDEEETAHYTHKETEVLYNSDDETEDEGEEYDYCESEDEDEDDASAGESAEEEDEDAWQIKLPYKRGSYRELPTIDEMSESEWMEAEEEARQENVSHQDREETDITELHTSASSTSSSPPLLSYTSTTDESEISDDDESNLSESEFRLHHVKKQFSRNLNISFYHKTSTNEPEKLLAPTNESAICT